MLIRIKLGGGRFHIDKSCKFVAPKFKTTLTVEVIAIFNEHRSSLRKK